jgi:16S rRNA (guanine966-N2)-methyltransferase
MRVIAGSARGRHLRAVASSRPTADLIKGVIFSMLEALAYKRGFEPDDDGHLAAALAWPRVLDLFAGSGALGIEALSRGATCADFIEQDRQAARVVEANLRTTGLAERGRVHHAPVALALRRVQAPIDLVLVDPPYAEHGALRSAADQLTVAELLRPSSVVVLEQPAEAQPFNAVGPLELHATRVHGRTRVSLFAT